VRRALDYTCTRAADNEYGYDTDEGRNFAAKEGQLPPMDLEGEILLTQGNRVMDNRIYDATLNNFARLSISAALASPTTK
jgi:hypothetical protein